MGIWYTLLKYARNYGAPRTTWETQDWTMVSMCGNRNHTWKYYAKNIQRKMSTWKFLRQNTRLQKILKEFWRNESCTHYCYCKRKTARSRKDMHVTGLYKKHTGSTYRILNIFTKRTVLSRDGIWLNKTMESTDK